MNKTFSRIFFCLFIAIISLSQSKAQQNVFTQDIDNFWVAYDSIRTTTDSLRQINFINTLYINKATPGLKAFMVARNYSAQLYVQLINKLPKFWNSIRPHTLLVKSKVNDIEKSISRLKVIYPGLKNAKMYFTIGGLRSGGTTKDSMVLVGAEIATGDSTVDVSELNSKWLAGVFKEQSADNLVSLNVHEYIHTQQSGESNNLLAQAIAEGACDFIAELIIDKPLKGNYIAYGKANEPALKEAFKLEMFTTAFNRWLYNGSNAKTVADLGYFMGYEICKHYYNNAADKKQAVKDIITLNFGDTAAVEAFLQKSGYYKEAINKQQLLQQFEAKQPKLAGLEPFENGDTLVSASTKQITLVFSAPMGSGYSINIGDRGKEFFPLSGVVGFSADKTKFTVTVDLKPGHEYEFVVTNRSFSSEDNYPLLKDYTIRFKTKP